MPVSLCSIRDIISKDRCAQIDLNNIRYILIKIDKEE